MYNPALAVLTSEDPIKLNMELVHIWESYVVTGRLPEKKIRSVVSESWKRCSSFGINSRLHKAHKVLSEEELFKMRIDAELRDIAQPIINDLAETIAGTKHMAFLCNSKGQIVEAVGDADVQERASLNNLIVGADWSEEGAGTNAIGTAIKHQGPVQIFSAEHYCEGWHCWTCTATPIIDPISKKIIGVLDLTGPWNSYQRHTLALVVAQAKAIERSLLEKELIGQQKLTNRYIDICGESTKDGLIVIDMRGRVIRLNEQAAKRLNIDPGKVVGQTVTDFPDLNNAFSEIIRLGKPNTERELFITDNRTGQKIRLISKTITDNNKFLGVLITLPFVSLFRKGEGSFADSDKALMNEEVDVINNKGRKTAKVIFRAAEVETRSNAARYNFQSILGKSEIFLKSIEMAKRAALNEATVIIQGESGTGKELVAQAIHLASKRTMGPFIAINCGALPKELVGSELFGYADGAFTGANKGGNPGKFELAKGGTIFFDEIGEMPLDQQVNLLRVLQEKEVTRIGGRKTIPIDVRIIAASNKNLSEEVKKGNFREDLFYRLYVIDITLPPLRKRREDISLLVHNFLDKARKELGRPCLRISNEALKILEVYDWPGNVRELCNVIERTVQMSYDDNITPDNLPPEVIEMVRNKSDMVIAKNEIEKNETVTDLSIIERYERDILLNTVKQCNDNMTKAAAQLNMARSTLYRKLKRFGCI
ncbi:MAG: sigma-54-dependent Fis family transcriptional regulator [Desulfitobacteriaceae bacterium]|nr:sigma-54-dependent Fis family transcriptional regulator [Desulfitobacteriaceae bacterium]